MGVLEFLMLTLPPAPSQVCHRKLKGRVSQTPREGHSSGKAAWHKVGVGGWSSGHWTKEGAEVLLAHRGTQPPGQSQALQSNPNFVLQIAEKEQELLASQETVQVRD